MSGDPRDGEAPGVPPGRRSGLLMAEAGFEAKAVAGINAAGQDDPKFWCWLLERKYPQRWGRYRGELGELKRRIKQLEALLGDDPAPGGGDK